MEENSRHYRPSCKVMYLQKEYKKTIAANAVSANANAVHTSSKQNHRQSKEYNVKHIAHQKLPSDHEWGDSPLECSKLLLAPERRTMVAKVRC